jgi:hypothetical protein
VVGRGEADGRIRNGCWPKGGKNGSANEVFAGVALGLWCRRGEEMKRKAVLSWTIIVPEPIDIRTF